MEKRIKNRLSLIKRRSQMSEVTYNYNTKISIKKLFEIFKESPEDFTIIKSMIKLKNYNKSVNLDNEGRNELISAIIQNMKKKNLFFFFFNFYKKYD